MIPHAVQVSNWDEVLLVAVQLHLAKFYHFNLKKCS